MTDEKEKTIDVVAEKDVEMKDKNIETKENDTDLDKKKPNDKDSKTDQENETNELSELEMLKSELEKIKLETLYSKLTSVLDDYQINEFNNIFIKNSLEEKEKFANFILEIFPKKPEASGTTEKKEKEFLIY